MRQTKSLFALAALWLAAGTPLSAQEVFVVSTPQGQSSYALAAIRQITFTDDGMTVEAADQQYTFAYQDVSAMRFSQETTGISQILSPARSISYADGTLYGATGTPLTVYDLSGHQVAAGLSSVSVSHLPHGVYLVKTTSETLKFVR